MAVLAGLLLGAIFVIGLAQASYGVTVGLADANADGNIQGLANLMFSRYVFGFEATSALLITAAVGAMVLAHRERLDPKPSQADLAAQRMQDYAESGKHPGNLPTPGVFARHNAVDTPALLADGTAAEGSVSRVLSARGTVRSAPDMADDIAAIEQQLGDVPHAGRDQSAPATTEEEAPAT
jgi:NADH-quinone oxidoreductase subunit J